MVRAMETVEPPVTPETKETPPAPAVAPTKPSFTERMKGLVAEYGMVALGVYWGLFFLSIGLFTLLLRMGIQASDVVARLGMQMESTAGTASTLGVAYVATKLIQPVRIALTFVLTPMVGKLLHRFKKPAAR